MNKKKIIFVTIYIILIFLLAAYKHYTFQSTYELGIENRKLIQTMKGHFYYFDDFDWNDLGNHFHIVNILIVFPIHYLFSSVYTLIIIKILALVTSALVVYEISKDLGDVADLLSRSLLFIALDVIA